MDFKNWAKQKEFTEEDIKLYEKRSNYFNWISTETFINNYDDSIAEFQRLGFTISDARRILLLCTSNVTIRNKYEKRLKNIVPLLGSNHATNLYLTAIYLKSKSDTLADKISFLYNESFSNEDIQKILNRNALFLTTSLDKFKSIFNHFKKIKVSKEKVKEIFITHPKIINGMTAEKNDSSILRICKYGFTKKEAYEIARIYIKILVIKDTSIESAFKIYKKCGLKKKETIKLLASKPKLINPKTEIFEQVKKDLKEKGFRDEEINHITLKANEIPVQKHNKVEPIYEVFYKQKMNDIEIKKTILGNPKIFYHSKERISKTIEVLNSFDITNEEIINVFINFPRIIESAPESLYEKIKLLSVLDILKITLINPKNLIQGCEKTYLRYLYVFNILQDEITGKNVSLIYNSKSPKVPKIEELRMMYSYVDDMENSLYKRLSKTKENNKKTICLH